MFSRLFMDRTITQVKIEAEVVSDRLLLYNQLDGQATLWHILRDPLQELGLCCFGTDVSCPALLRGEGLAVPLAT
jgi:hypothetical protein